MAKLELWQWWSSVPMLWVVCGLFPSLKCLWKLICSFLFCPSGTLPVKWLRAAIFFYFFFKESYVAQIPNRLKTKAMHNLNLLCLFALPSIFFSPFFLACWLFVTSEAWVMLWCSICWRVSQTVVFESLWIFDKWPASRSAPRFSFCSTL